MGSRKLMLALALVVAPIIAPPGPAFAMSVGYEVDFKKGSK